MTVTRQDAHALPCFAGSQQLSQAQEPSELALPAGCFPLCQHSGLRSPGERGAAALHPDCFRAGGGEQKPRSLKQPWLGVVVARQVPWGSEEQLCPSTRPRCSGLWVPRRSLCGCRGSLGQTSLLLLREASQRPWGGAAVGLHQGLTEPG